MKYWGWSKPKPKKPPPAHGLKVKKAGATWWGQRWIQALVHVLEADRGRLLRGRAYARAGRTHDLVIKGGQVTAKVTGSQRKPYEIKIQLDKLDADKWNKAIAGMAAKAQFSVELLAGQMPQRIDEVFREANASLFPQKKAEIKTSCSCPDWGDPCKHVAATHYVLGEAFDRDPFLLFELRGKTKNEVLEALRIARGGDADVEVAEEIPSVQLGSMPISDYDKPRTPLPALFFSFDEPAYSGALLRQLGAPSCWRGTVSPTDMFGPTIRAAAEKARLMAMTDFQQLDEVGAAERGAKGGI
ncbi:MAG TPA: SWIM zinc finger family protein [Polyangium sp.]|nr:SWIM zinc finger family protein [Polyangium sp.]